MVLKQAIKNPFVKYFLLLLAGTVIFDLVYKSWENSQMFLTGQVFGHMFIFFGVVYGAIFFCSFIIRFIFKKITPRTYSSSQKCECDRCVQRRSKSKKKKATKRRSKK